MKNSLWNDVQSINIIKGTIKIPLKPSAVDSKGWHTSERKSCLLMKKVSTVLLFWRLSQSFSIADLDNCRNYFHIISRSKTQLSAYRFYTRLVNLRLTIIRYCIWVLSSEHWKYRALLGNQLHWQRVPSEQHMFSRTSEPTTRLS